MALTGIKDLGGGVTANIFHMGASSFGTERTRTPEEDVGSVDSGHILLL